MNQKLQECLEGNFQKNILPFFWQHGDSLDKVAAMIDVIQASNVDAFCVESRIHEDFCREKWWDDFGFILQEAEKRNMKVWLLDDRRFPSGFANDYLKENPEHIRKMVRERYVDVVGPQRQISLSTNHFWGNETLLYVLAYQRDADGTIIRDSCIDLTERIHDGLILWDVPEGFWRIHYLIQTTEQLEFWKYYVDMLSPESCRAMIEAIYEPHYEHFAKYFGNTFMGFFSDEPCFCNEIGTYRSKLGKLDVPLPWNQELIRMIAEKYAISEWEVVSCLPGLWYDMDSGVDLIRYGYMDAVSERFGNNFSKQIGDWCRAHGVEYIGHVIEDMNAHMRLGYGCGHYFRAMEGQDMAGLDVVLHQIVPGFTDMTHHARISDHGVADPEFYDYTLAKLGASAAHIDPKKKNRCMCEIFGAYGWAEGLPMMKYLADYFLVNGVNYFVPHAFTNRHPNHDCPPHFWADGKNPQFEYMGELMNYMNRCSHLLSDSVHCADVAVFYNAEGEWCAGENMLFQRITKLLTRNQIDFDIVPYDCLAQDAYVKDNRLCVNEETYGALLISYSEKMPFELMRTFCKMAGEGLPVIFADGLPKSHVGGTVETEATKKLLSVSLSEIPNYLEQIGFKRFHVEDHCPSLRFYHVKRDYVDTVMFFNDSIFNDLDIDIKIPLTGKLTWYDPWTGEVWKEETEDGNIRLSIARYSTLFVMSGDDESEIHETGRCNLVESATTYKPNLLYDIYVKEPELEEQLYAKETKLFNLSAPGHLPNFCGNIRYVTRFHMDDKSAYVGVDLGEVGETAEVIVNGQHCGLRIQPPYRFNIEGALQEGENVMEITVANSYAYRERDGFSPMIAISPSGVLGDVVFWK